MRKDKWRVDGWNHSHVLQATAKSLGTYAGLAVAVWSVACSPQHTGPLGTGTVTELVSFIVFLRFSL